MDAPLTSSRLTHGQFLTIMGLSDVSEATCPSLSRKHSCVRVLCTKPRHVMAGISDSLPQVKTLVCVASPLNDGN